MLNASTLEQTWKTWSPLFLKITIPLTTIIIFSWSGTSWFHFRWHKVLASFPWVVTMVAFWHFCDKLPTLSGHRDIELNSPTQFLTTAPWPFTLRDSPNISKYLYSCSLNWCSYKEKSRRSWFPGCHALCSKWHFPLKFHLKNYRLTSGCKNRVR